MSEQTKQEPQGKVFKLSPEETQTLAIIQTSHQRTFAATLSLIAQGSMGYQVSERTQFKLNPDFTEMEISEIPQDVPVTDPEAPKAPEPPKPATGAVEAK